MMRQLILGIAMFATVSCGGGLPEVPPGQPVSYGRHLEPLVLARCLGCHTAEKPEAELVLAQGRGYPALVGRASVQVPAMSLVVPGDSEHSYLWLKVDHRAAKGRGMPRTLTGSKRLADDELTLIRRWIEDGARP